MNTDWVCLSIPGTAGTAHLHFIKTLPRVCFSSFTLTFLNVTILYGFTINYADLYALCQLSRIYGAFRTRRNSQRPPWLTPCSVDETAVLLSSSGRHNRRACSFQHSSITISDPDGWVSFLRCFIFSESGSSLVCLHLFAVLEQVNRHSAEAKTSEPL